MVSYDTFLYEVTIYKVYKKDRRSELIYSIYYKSDKFIPDKCIAEYIPNIKKTEIIYLKSFTLVGAPKDYIEHLQKSKIKKHEKRNCTVRHRKV